MFRRSSTLTQRDTCDFGLLLWGHGANTGQLAYLRRHFHLNGNDGADARFNLAHARPIGTHKSAKFRRSSTPTPRDKCDFRLLLWGNGPIRAS
ncbi:hypothetical protein DPMN_025667 [Dreissena polymorpha]|uniref:Uncharacterized protein n=1 Tax=Dreissena polymorpha TaxID=45954 RepID=A0A9D4RC18_DREPO|nr:hypothetical protein DPMN_025667 [Dreissena polymorpha]